MNLRQAPVGRKAGFLSAVLLSLLFVAIASYLVARDLHPLLAELILPQPAAAAETAPQPLAPASSTPVRFSTTTPEQVINALTVADVVPATGKFIAANLSDMKLTLYKDGSAVATYPILTKGKDGSPYATPTGVYSVLSKEQDHFNRKEAVHMPYSMQFYGNYFIHGWPYYTDGRPVNPAYSGGCIRLSTTNAQKVFAFAQKGTGVFVYAPLPATSSTPLILQAAPAPSVSAMTYLIADVDTGDVYLQKNAQALQPVGSLTRLMTALVANETIMFNDEIRVPRYDLDPYSADPHTKDAFTVGDLIYPLLLQPSDTIADLLARYYDTRGFVNWMNSTARSLGMASTTFVDASGASAQDVSTADDLYRLAVYLEQRKSFVWNVTDTAAKDLVADDGYAHKIRNLNVLSASPYFVGGVDAAQGMVSVFSIPINGVTRHIAIVVLGSPGNPVLDTSKLESWFGQAASAQ